ncbi:L-lactate oxidase [Salmonella enterica subsp. enterica]|uniref:L-lactate oxidase n=1 Tax=Salmonella enterica I TaxID=59201 RepID=A0A447PC34_SALET|nr:L-lactate oxidase [Salmonella enterica subsp. enterica]
MMKTNHLIRVVASLAMLATSGLAYAEEYKASTDEKAIKMTNVASLEARVQARMEKGHLVIFAVEPKMRITFAATPKALTKNILCRAYYRALS